MSWHSIELASRMQVAPCSAILLAREVNVNLAIHTATVPKVNALTPCSICNTSIDRRSQKKLATGDDYATESFCCQQTVYSRSPLISSSGVSQISLRCLSQFSSRMNLSIRLSPQAGPVTACSYEHAGGWSARKRQCLCPPLQAKSRRRSTQGIVSQEVQEETRYTNGTPKPAWVK